MKWRVIPAMMVLATVGRIGAQPPSRLNEAIELAVAAEYQEALELFKLELAFHPEDPLRHYLVGMTEFKLGHYSAALGRFQGALEADAEFPQVYYWMARAYQETGKTAAALSILERGLERFSRNEDLSTLHDLLSHGEALPSAGPEPLGPPQAPRAPEVP